MKILDDKPRNESVPERPVAPEVSPLSELSVGSAACESIAQARRLADARASLLNSVLENGLLSVEELLARGISAKTGGDTFVDESGKRVVSKGVLIVVDTLQSRETVAAESPGEAGWSDESRSWLAKGLLQGDGGAERSPPLVVGERKRPDILEELEEGVDPAEMSERLSSSVIFVMRFDETRDALEDRCIYRDGGRTYGYDRIPPENIVAVLVPRPIHEELLEGGGIESYRDKLIPVDGSVDLSELVPYGVEPGKVTLPSWTGALDDALSRVQSELRGAEETSVAIHAMRLDTRSDLREG